jgi:hypothetical protein
VTTRKGRHKIPRIDWTCRHAIGHSWVRSFARARHSIGRPKSLAGVRRTASSPTNVAQDAAGRPLYAQGSAVIVCKQASPVPDRPVIHAEAVSTEG